MASVSPAPRGPAGRSVSVRFLPGPARGLGGGATLALSCGTLTTRHRSIAALLREAMAGQPELMVRRLGRLIRTARDPDQRERRQNLLDDVAFNAQGIRNLPRSPVIGSGPVEKQVDVLLCRRLKTRGMSWFRPGAAALQRLRELKLNREWDTHWRERDLATARHAA